ncbi:FAD-dependent oxidoreductase [Massilia sp. TWR1-2-2]|uniref:FAD-dependent oxidoreductase n=1 Tax=Massilia sp. TWR1-2-2 TaxID=2804584 RepID=UPI003CF52B39
MSYFTFKRADASVHRNAGSLRSAFSQWLLQNHGGHYRAKVGAQRARVQARQFQSHLAAAAPGATAQIPLVGIVGGGFAGLYAGLMLQSLGIGCELFESSERVGGRIRTWYSSDYAAGDPERAGLYGELGGMRLPQFSADMLPVQQLALAVNAVLARSGLGDAQVSWCKFYYDSPAQRLRYNNMASFTTAASDALTAFGFGEADGGDVPQAWVTPTTDAHGNIYLPINKVLQQVNKPFLAAINASFAEGFAAMMQYDQYSMWDYLTTVFTVGDMQQFYDPAMGAKSDLLPWAVASYLETTNVGTGMYAVSFVEMVIAVYDWGGSINPYRPGDSAICMLTVDQGMQRFPDACRMVLDIEQGVGIDDGRLAQVQVGMLPACDGGPYSYDPPNLTVDARPVSSAAAAAPAGPAARAAAKHQRVFLQHKVEEMAHDATLFDGHGGIRLRIRDLAAAGGGAMIERRYPYVITTLPNGAYLNGQLGGDLLSGLSYAKAQAIRQCEFMPAFKAFLTFKRQFWATLGQRQDGGLGAAATDRPNRQIIYPSYGYEASQGVLQVYCWAQDAQRLGALDDEERIAECLKGIAYLYPDADVHAQFAGYEDGRTTKTWFWDNRAGGAAFALFNPGQYKNIYPELLTPEFGGCLNFAGECCSVHHGWIVGALDSAYNAVHHILAQAGADDKIRQMEAIWGAFAPPDIGADAATAGVLDYKFAYNQVDRDAAAVAPHATASIYGDSTFSFNGNVPAFVADFNKVPQAMKANARDRLVLQMLNDQWDDNVAQRGRAGSATVRQRRREGAPASTADMLEDIYYGNNFQTIPAPQFWLKDDDEFARQQLAGFMPTLLQKVTLAEVRAIVDRAAVPNPGDLGALEQLVYVADYRRYLQACTVTPAASYLPKPIVFFSVNDDNELVPVGLQLERGGELFWPGMPNASNAWLLAKMLTNCAGQTLHDVGFHQLLTHQICAMVSIALFSEEVFNPLTQPCSAAPFQQHPVFKLLRPHVVKTAEFQQTIYNSGYDPFLQPFPATREVNGKPGVYNLGFVYDLMFSCGRIGNYQLQDHIYNGDGSFRFLEQAIPVDAGKRGVLDTPFSYPYVHDTLLWYKAIARFTGEFVDTCYAADDSVRADVQLQRFFGKLMPAFNYVDGTRQAQRFPASVVTRDALKEVLAMFVWQFSVQHTVINDGAYNHAAFVPNASTLMFAPPVAKASRDWTAADVLACLPSQDTVYPSLGNMNFMDVQINASVTGQGPYPETVFGRGILAPAIAVLQDSYAFSDGALRSVVDRFYQDARSVGAAIEQRQARDSARYLALHPDRAAVPATVVFDLVRPDAVMNAIQT